MVDCAGSIRSKASKVIVLLSAAASVIRLLPNSRAIFALVSSRKKNQTCVPLPDLDRSTAASIPWFFCDKPNGVCRFFPIGSVKVDDQDFCVAVTIENVLTYDVSEPVVVAFEMGDDRGIAQLGEDAVAAFRAFGFLTI